MPEQLHLTLTITSENGEVHTLTFSKAEGGAPTISVTGDVEKIKRRLAVSVIGHIERKYPKAEDTK